MRLTSGTVESGIGMTCMWVPRFRTCLLKPDWRGSWASNGPVGGTVCALGL